MNSDETRDTELEHRFIDTGGVSLHTVVAGPPDGESAVLLHGFPEFWYGWRHQIPALAGAGYRVIVPDQRGYNRSDKPSGLDPYTVDKLAADPVGLLDALNLERARFVGHDWGAGILWQILLHEPDRVDQAVIMNGPHPSVFQEVLLGNPRQLLKSYYMFLFQLPTLPEWVLRFGGWRVLRGALETSNREDAFTPAELERYRKSWSRPGALTAMLNWYRALFRRDENVPATGEINVPVLILWGEQDSYLVPELARASVDQCTDGNLERVVEATHWLHHEFPDRINRSILEFFDRP